MQMNEKVIVRADDMKRPIPLYDFKAFGEAIKEARKKRGESRNKASSDLRFSTVSCHYRKPWITCKPIINVL